jgi:hypothetical protein
MFNTYKELFNILKQTGSFVVSATFTPARDEEIRKIVNLHHAGIVTIEITTFGFKVTRNRAKQGESAVMAHPNGIAQLKHKIIAFNGEYVVIEHPTLKMKLNRKVTWNEQVNGWVAA